MNTEVTLNGKSAEAHRIADWDAYSEPFLSVMPSRMLQLNQEVASYSFGEVADFGCGAGKIIPFLLSRNGVRSYTGIDSSSVMVKRARWMSHQFTNKSVNIIQSSIEECQLDNIDTAISINSYYAWPDSTAVLNHIFDQLTGGSRFVLATINPDIDMPSLLEEAEMELVAHPHWAEFKRHNLEISECSDVQFVDLDTLVGQVRHVGFKVELAHCQLYCGGLNLLVLSKNR